MKEEISALVDGELDERAAAPLIAALGREGEARELWREYHLIGDAMRDTRPVSAGFAARLAERIAAEPTVVAPRRLPSEPRRWGPLPVAASVAAVALVGWLAFMPQQQVQPPLAKAPAMAVQASAPAKPAIVPLPSATNDYLLAHQGFSPRVALQGMAPYVRTVSDSRERAR